MLNNYTYINCPLQKLKYLIKKTWHYENGDKAKRQQGLPEPFKAFYDYIMITYLYPMSYKLNTHKVLEINYGTK